MLAELHQDPLTSHSRASNIREQALLHLLLGQLMAARWQQGRHDIEVLTSEVDRGGYDIVLEANGILRHVQLKSTFSGSSVRHVTVSTRLLEKPSGCVIWLEVDQRTLAFERYFWFGGQPGAPLPDLGAKISRHTRADSSGQKLERPLHRDLGKACFAQVDSAEQLLTRLFG